MFAGQTEAVHFLGPIKNVTVTVGRDASLSCSVGDLGIHRVSSTLCIMYMFYSNSFIQSQKYIQSKLSVFSVAL